MSILRKALPNIKQNYYKDTIFSALERSGVTTEQIDLVIPHGVGLKIIDRYEAKALDEIFDNKDKPFYSAFKPFVGHNLGGSTLLEMIILLLAIKNEIIPPTLNCQEKNKKINIDLETKFIKSSISNAVKTATAFGGFNGAVVLTKFNKLVYLFHY